MTTLAHAIRVVPDPILPPREDRDRDRRRTPLRSATWLRSQCAWYRHRAGECPVDAPLFELIETSLNDLAIACDRCRAETARELIARGPEPYRSIDLDRVVIPAWRSQSLADVLDCEAAYYLDLGTDVARLAAWAILAHSEGVEYHSARSVREYVEAEGREAAWIAAMDTVFRDDYASLESDTW